ncbi:hypothetical protein DH2020_036657 [Rehmannia glutinosa]|uniref:F-box domain-containing protein n=1 Tax=Rehmannia glutinosa TaxID=99300 RepID=A0ABR0V6D4_REHGL
MESKNKKSKKNQEKEEENHDLDRLSALPDSILSHILSFLDTRSAIRTSVLSERYRLVWNLSQCLDFTLWESQSVVSFESFVNRVLRLREPSNLTKFRISLHRGVSSEFMQNCVDYAARHRVEHLRIRACFSVNVSERKQRTSEGFFSMLRQLCNVEFLSVSLKTAEVMAALPDLEARTPTIFENLSVLEFTDENGCREKRLPIHIDIHPPEIATDVMIFDFSKEKETLTWLFKGKKKKVLESSPSLELVGIEIPKRLKEALFIALEALRSYRFIGDVPPPGCHRRSLPFPLSDCLGTLAYWDFSHGRCFSTCSLSRRDSGSSDLPRT